jgi:hypothetical protein
MSDELPPVLLLEGGAEFLCRGQEMTDHDHGGCHGRLARPCDAFTGGLAARGTPSQWSIFSHQLP